MPLQMNIISGAEIRAKSKSGMTSDQIAKELLNSPTRDEVKPSEVAQLKDEIKRLEEQLNRYPEGAAGYTNEEFEELVNVMDDIENHPDYDQDERFESGYDAGRCSVEIADEKDDEIEKNKKELLEQLERITDLKVQNEKLKQDTDVLVKGMETLQNKYMNECSPKLIAERDTYKMNNDKLKEENKKLKENSETQTTAIRALTKQLEYECGDTSDMEGLNEFLNKYSSKEDYKKFYDWFEMSEYDVEFIESEE